ncbi:MAG: hypothetical protein K0R89_3519, partial [Ramlibacter sp.]|nr:hypothetical protein [Ramlibacter sp.]
MTHRPHGFSLVESVVTLAIAGTLVALGASSLADLFHGLRLQALSGNLFQQVLLARSEAIKRNGR